MSKRKIIDAFECDTYLYALSNDGVLFVQHDNDGLSGFCWLRLADLPEGE